MHRSSKKRMGEFVQKYLDHSRKLRILDVGSYDINGSYKELFTSPNWEYVGADIEEGPNVDILLKHHYQWNIPEESFDVIISGQCMEHVEDLKEWISPMKKILKKDGLVCIIGPNKFKEHRHPVDCWRIFPDGMRFLLGKVCSFKVLECFKKGIDTVGIARKT